MQKCVLCSWPRGQASGIGLRETVITRQPQVKRLVALQRAGQVLARNRRFIGQQQLFQMIERGGVGLLRHHRRAQPFEFHAQGTDFQIAFDAQHRHAKVARRAQHQRFLLHQLQHGVAHGRDAGTQLQRQLADAQPVVGPKAPGRQRLAQPRMDGFAQVGVRQMIELMGHVSIFQFMMHHTSRVKIVPGRAADSTIPDRLTIMKGRHLNWDYPQPHTVAVTPQAGDIDGLRHTNNAVYVRWCEHVAWHHSKALGLDLDDYRRLDRAMAIRRGEYDYLLPTHEGEALSLSTWLCASDGRSSMERRFQLVRDSDGATVVRGRWELICIELSSGRARRLPPEFLAVYEPAVVGNKPV